jgi:hypothetical protein
MKKFPNGKITFMSILLKGKMPRRFIKEVRLVNGKPVVPLASLYHYGSQARIWLETIEEILNKREEGKNGREN